jgi:hypothetical protein
MPIPTLYQEKALTYQGELIEEIPANFIIRKMSNLYFEKNKNIFLLQSLTGSGKSSAFIISLYKHFKFMKKKIVTLNPRVANVDNLIAELTTENWVTNMLDGHKIKLGEEIGYGTGKMKIKTRAKNGIMYYTYGSFFEKLLNNQEKTLEKIGVLVLDEVHEDNLELFLLLMKLKQALNKNIKLPLLILTSATFDVDSFKNYYNVEDDRVFYVAGGQQYNKEFIFLDKDCEDVKAEVIKVIKSIPNDGYDILTFISSAKEIDDYKRIIPKIPELKDEIVIGLNRDIIQSSKKDYQILYDKGIKRRRLIFGNETVETGVTMNNLKYVIILGWTKSNDYIPYFNSTLLYDEPLSKASYTQRAGRVGRKFEGVVYNLFTKKTLESLKAYKILSIFRKDISILLLYYLEDFDLIKVIPKELIYDGIYKLFFLGFIELIEKENDDLILYKNIKFDKKYSFDNFKLTSMGKIAQKFYIPMIELNLSEIKLILTALFMEINIFEIVTIIAMMKAYKGDVIYNEKEEDRNDFITLLLEYNKQMLIFEEEINKIDINNIKNFKILDKIIEKHNKLLFKNNIIEVLNMKDSILTKLYELGYDLKKYKENKSILNYDNDDMYNLKKCIYYAYFINFVSDNKYRDILVKANIANKKNYICNNFKIEKNMLIPNIIVYI